MVPNRCLAFVFALVCAIAASPAGANGYAVFFGNGVGNSFEDARLSKNRLIELYGRTAPDGQTIEYRRAYAFSGDGFTKNSACDFAEVYLQNAAPEDTWTLFKRALAGFAAILSTGLSEALNAAVVNCTAAVKAERSGPDYTDTDLKRHERDYTKLIKEDGKKVLVVAHSQGNFYANLALRKVTQDTTLPPGLNIVIVGVASPANEVAQAIGDTRKNPYVTSKSDLVIRGLDVLSPQTLDWTFAFSDLPDNPKAWVAFNSILTGDWKGHGFLPVYANGDLEAWPLVKEQIDAGFAEFVPKTPNKPPIASFSVSVGSANTTTVEVGQTVDFDGSASFDPEGSSLSYKWDVRDVLGTTVTFSTSPRASRVFLLPGPYEITLTVTDNLLASSEAKRTITVKESNPAPIAAFTARVGSTETFTVAVGQEIVFDPSGSSDPGGAITNYEWDFGTGSLNMASAAPVPYVYTTPNVYTVRLKVTDNGTPPRTGEVSHLVTVTAAPGLNRYAVVNLGDVTPAAINDSGQVTGRYLSNGVLRAFVWSSGVFRDLGELGTQPSPIGTTASGINNSGRIVGSSHVVTTSNPNGVLRPFVYASGSMSDLGINPGGQAAATSLNDFGDVVGDFTSLTTGRSHAYVLRGTNLTDLSALSPLIPVGTATSVNNLGQVVGFGSPFVPFGCLYGGVVGTTGFIYSGGTVSALLPLVNGADIIPTAINDRGQVVGYARSTADAATGCDYQHAFLWENGITRDIHSLGGTLRQGSYAYGINNLGQVVGYTAIPDGNSVRGAAFLWQDGTMIDLNTRIDPNLGWVLDSAVDINESGQIVGTGRLNGEARGFLLTSQPLPPPSAPDIERVNVASDGTQGNGEAYLPSISADGRFVAFMSSDSNLVPGDTNGSWDVFVHDRQTGATTRVSVASDGTQSQGQGSFDIQRPSISADGRFVAFTSSATNLVPGDTNGRPDVFVHDRQTGTTTRVSVASNGEQANSEHPYGSRDPSISADGRFVAFTSSASNLVPGDTNGFDDVFVHDRQTGATTLVSVANSGERANHSSLRPSLSADGYLVAFESAANNLVGPATNMYEWNIFVHDRRTGVTTRVNVPSNGDQTYQNRNSSSASISADGRFVAFESNATNLVPGDTNEDVDVFVHDRQTGTTSRVSVADNGAQANGSSATPSISADGRFVAFTSSASNLVASDSNGAEDVFVHDRQTGATTLVSVGGNGVQGNNSSFGSSISADGRFVAFASIASNLVAGDTNNARDAFVKTMSGAAPYLSDFDYSPTPAETAYVGMAFGFNGLETGQSFPIGRTGTLTQIDLKILTWADPPPGGNLYVRFYTIPGSGFTLPSTSSVLTVTVPFSALPRYTGQYSTPFGYANVPWTSITLPGSGLPVVAGQRFLVAFWADAYDLATQPGVAGGMGAPIPYITRFERPYPNGAWQNVGYGYFLRTYVE